MVGAIVYQLTRDLNSDIVKDSGFGDYFINHATGVYPANSNGSPFNAYINGMPLKFILGKNEQFNNYNPNFYKVGASLPSQLKGWFGLHDENSYCFSETTTLNENIWSDFCENSRD